MRNLFLLPLLLLLACGENPAPEDGADTPDAPAFLAVFQPVLEDLATAESATGIAAQMMTIFPSVSDPETNELNVDVSEQFVALARRLSDKFPQDTAAALPLYRAAEVTQALGDPQATADLYQLVHQRYPTFSRAPESLFMLAFTQDEGLGDLDRARATYLDFLDRYPDHGFADDTEMLLENLGKSDEEILQSLRGN